MEKASLIQAERLDFLSSEINKLIKSQSQGNSLFDQYINEYYDLILSYDWRDEVFEENGKKGFKNVKGEVVVPPIYDDFCCPEAYTEKVFKVGAVKDGKVALVKRDGTGEPVTDFEYHYIERIENSVIYACWKPNDLKHFALMVAGAVITPYELDGYGEVCDGCLIVTRDGKYGVLAIDQGLVYVSPIYDEIIDQGVGEDFLFVKDGVNGVVTLDNRFIANDQFEQLDDEEYDNIMSIGFIGAPDFDF